MPSETEDSKVTFIKSISIFLTNLQIRLFANDSYCSSIIPYMPMWKITIHVVAFSINQ